MFNSSVTLHGFLFKTPTPWSKSLSWESKVAHWPGSFVSSTGHLTFLLHDTIRQSSRYSRSQLSGYGTHDDFECLPLPSDSHSYSPHAMIHQIPEKFKETKEQILRKCMWWTITRIQFLRRTLRHQNQGSGEIFPEFTVPRKMCLHTIICTTSCSYFYDCHQFLSIRWQVPRKALISGS